MATGLNNTEEGSTPKRGGFWGNAPRNTAEDESWNDSDAELEVAPPDEAVAAEELVQNEGASEIPEVPSASEQASVAPSWETELSWDDDVDDDPTNPNGTALEVDAVQELDESRYIPDSPAPEPQSVFDGGDTGYLGASSAYDEGDAIGRMTSKSSVRVVAVVVSVLVALIAVYAFGVRRFSSHLLPNTHINGCDVAGLTVEEAVAALEKETGDYTCAVKVEGLSTEVKGADISLERDEAAMVGKAFSSQSAYAWPVALVAAPRVETEASLTFNEDALKEIVTKAVDEYNEKTLPDDEAWIDFDEESGQFQVLGTTKGTAVDAESLGNAVAKDVREFKAECTPDAKEVTHVATVWDIPSYAKTAEAANRSRTHDIPILVNGETVITSTADQHVEWVKIGEGPSVDVDEEAVRAWAQYYVADAVFHRDDWSNYYLGEDEFVSVFCDRLANGIVDGYEAPCWDELRTEGESREKAYAKGGWDSNLGRYIDVDLESQFARLFDESGNVIWESAFVSGDMYEGRPTVTGTYEIYSMQRDTTLVGMDYDNDGQPDYESFVSFWMPFYGGYGLHDATWRSHFGGDYYYYDGSHGCVNLPYSKAESLYGMTHVGEKVNVHW